MLIRSGVDTRHFDPAVRCTGRNGGALRLVHVASLKPLKDQWTLLRSVAELDKECKDWELTIAGKDQANVRPGYENFVREHGLAGKVRFVGSIPDTRDVLKFADVFLLTSVTEALPIAAIEALAMGIPCIVTNVGGNPDIIEHGREGYLVQPNDQKAIAAHIKYLGRNPAARTAMGIADREKALSCFDFARMVDDYSALFLRVLRR